LASAGANAYVACNFLSWMDQAAYAAWAGLRPFTELEYEKMSRGTANAVANEYVWGTTNITQVTGISNSGAANEIASNAGNGLCVYGNHGSVQGPLRTGFAAWGSTNRQTAGASFYGVMELSGNLWERPVSVGNATGRDFTGTHGSGLLSTNGFATNSDWPGYVTAEVTAATGSGFRGGFWLSTAVNARVSDRRNAANVDGYRNINIGARCARTSP
jgi:formylglycine-generating enzyme required for sulfatase activity